MVWYCMFEPHDMVLCTLVCDGIVLYVPTGEFEPHAAVPIRHLRLCVFCHQLRPPLGQLPCSANVFAVLLRLI